MVFSRASRRVVCFGEGLNGVEQRGDLAVGKAVGADDDAVVEPEEVVGGDVEEAGQFHKERRGGGGEPHFPGVDAGAGEGELFGEVGLRVAQSAAQFLQPLREILHRLVHPYHLFLLFYRINGDI